MRGIGVCVVDDDIFDQMLDHAAGRVMSFVKVPRHLGLAIDDDGFAGVSREVDVIHAAVDCDMRAVMGQTFAFEAVGDADLLHQADEPLFENASADAGKDMFARLAFQDDALDPVFVQEEREEEAGRAPADDGDLSSHGGIFDFRKR